MDDEEETPPGSDDDEQDEEEEEEEENDDHQEEAPQWARNLQAGIDNLAELVKPRRKSAATKPSQKPEEKIPHSAQAEADQEPPTGSEPAAQDLKLPPAHKEVEITPPSAQPTQQNPRDRAKSARSRRIWG